MTTEIELKYQLSSKYNDNSEIVTAITTMLNTKNITFEKNQNQLINDYFDNDNLDLRKMDFGLRIRTRGDKHEQTIKTAGIVKDGLHQRPEYNVDIESRIVNLALFPSHIWPENVDVMALQQSLQVLFSTNFSRHTWLIYQGDNIIELALDSGDISTTPAQPSVVINEIEIELVKGDKKALFTLAKQLLNIVSMHPSDVSKAARGYALYYDKIKKPK